MKKILYLILTPLFLNASVLELEKIRTDLYSKSGANVLKKVEISLEFSGNDLEKYQTKIIDSVNTVISGFFYEDIFTELGKNNFKKTLEKFINKKYKIQVDDIYILSLNSVEKFDIEEFKRFLQSAEIKNTKKKTEIQKALDNLEVPSVESLSNPTQNLEVPKIPNTPKIENLEVKQISQLFNDGKEDEENTDLKLENLKGLKIPDNLEEKIKQDLIADPSRFFKDRNTSVEQVDQKQGFDLKLDQNTTQN